MQQRAATKRNAWPISRPRQLLGRDKLSPLSIHACPSLPCSLLVQCDPTLFLLCTFLSCAYFLPRFFLLLAKRNGSVERTDAPLWPPLSGCTLIISWRFKLLTHSHSASETVVVQQEEACCWWSTHRRPCPVLRQASWPVRRFPHPCNHTLVYSCRHILSF